MSVVGVDVLQPVATQGGPRRQPHCDRHPAPGSRAVAPNRGPDGAAREAASAAVCFISAARAPGATQVRRGNRFTENA